MKRDYVQRIDYPGVREDSVSYSEGLRVRDTIYISGQGPEERVGGTPSKETIEQQTESTLKNVQRILECHGLEMDDVIKVTVLLSDMAQLDRFDTVYRTFFNDPKPARIIVQSVLRGGNDVEIDAIAYKPTKGRLVAPIQAHQKLLQTLPDEKGRREIVETLQQLFPAVVSDVLDKRKLYNQVLASDIVPVWEEAEICGIARTLDFRPAEGLPPEGEEFKVMFEAIDTCRPGEVLVGNQVESCVWGEMMSQAAQVRGCRGFIAEGYVRDTRGIVSLGFPTFAKGRDCRDVLGRSEAVARDVPVRCGGVKITPGDYLIGNIDGVVVIPQAIAKEVIEEASRKASGEKLVFQKLKEGMPSAEAWKRYGIM